MAQGVEQSLHAYVDHRADNVRSLLQAVEDKLGVKRFSSSMPSPGAGVPYSATSAADSFRSTSSISGSFNSNILVEDSLHGVLPYGLPLPGVVTIGESPVWPALIARQLVRAGKWVAFLGMDTLNWSYIYSGPESLEQIVVVCDQEPLNADVVAAAIEGFDAIFLGGVRLSAREEKILHKKAEQRDAMIIARRWQGRALTLNSSLCKIEGLNQGRGYISHAQYLLESRYGEALISLSQKGTVESNSIMDRPQRRAGYPTNAIGLMEA
ncbi:MAG: hypothetical protein PUK40_00535 [Actinomycetaceae bacterium]|nr:hypothetical protein [Arcanobacterium sp.]MDD7504427.1 hypothetical protein [Actinomycetaceae bacterium]MDY6143615.1 hypothetical protein [Arcanobacterium sp.]